MRRFPVMCALLALAALNALATSQAATTVAPGIELIAGTFVPNHQPDGNSILFRTTAGFVVVDTGRHAAHTQQIIELAQQAGQPIAAVINSHWHLDHVGGNPRVRAAYPHARFYASDALADALKGFLANYRAQLEQAIAQSSDDQAKQAWRDEIAIIDAGAKLAPDELVRGSRTLTIGGRTLQLHLEKHSVTAGDVWVLDLDAHVLVAGDLVTLPVPFLDTACPAHWKTALDDLAHADFRQLIPGHGAPMSRADFETYRKAFGKLLVCAGGKSPKSACVDGWIGDASPLIAETDRAFAKTLLDYYIDNALRADPKKTAKLCGETS